MTTKETVRLSINRYQTFAAAASYGNLTKAAQALGYTQSGASHLLAALEDELGFPLLIRSRAGVAPTPEGEALLPYVKNMLASYQDIQAAAAKLRGVEAGALRVGTFTSVAIHWIPGLLHSFVDAYPGTDIGLLNGTYATVEQALVDNRIDCGFVTLPSRPEFSVISLQRDRLLVILHKDNPLAGRPSLTPAELADQPFILPAEGSDYDMGKTFAAAGVTADIKFDVSDDYAAVAMVRQGLGVTILPELILRGQPLDQLSVVPLENAQREIGLATNASRLPSPVLKAFLSHLRQNPDLLRK